MAEPTDARSCRTEGGYARPVLRRKRPSDCEPRAYAWGGTASQPANWTRARRPVSRSLRPAVGRAVGGRTDPNHCDRTDRSPMRAMVCTDYGPPDVLRLRDLPKPDPEDDEVLIRIRATTASAADCELRRFDFSPWIWLPMRLSFGIRRPRRPVLGHELAGDVESVGKDVRSFKKGDRVFAATVSGWAPTRSTSACARTSRPARSRRCRRS